MNFNSFPSIESFHNVRKNIRVDVDSQPGKIIDPVRIIYRPKIKLHGTNAGVNITKEGPIAQSRKNVITPGSDNMGFAAWVDEHNAFWSQALQTGITFFGEWFGRKIMKGTVASDLPNNYFAIFAIQFGPSHSEFDTTVNSDPELIQNYVDDMAEIAGYKPDSVLVMPWADTETEIDFTSEESMQEGINQFNQRVADVEKEDPFIKDSFGYSGPGEGLVYYPVGVYGRRFEELTTSRWFFSKYVFKAKGEKHKVTKTKQAVQMDPETAASVEEFCEKTVTEARLEQGMMETVGSMDFNKKYIGPFLAWVGKDVKKECQAELEASGLTWKDVNKAVQGRARNWLLKKAEEI